MTNHQRQKKQTKSGKDPAKSIKMGSKSSKSVSGSNVKNKTQTAADKKITKLLGLSQSTDSQKKNSKFTFSLIKKQVSPVMTAIINMSKGLRNSFFVRSIQNRFFDSNEKQIEKLRKIVDKIEALEEEMSAMTQEEMRQAVVELRKEFQEKLPPDAKLFTEKGKAWLETKQGSKIYEFIMEKLPFCYALVREVAKRTSNHRHFPVQLMAGIALAQGRIIEFKTGEGKTLVAPLALFLYSLFGRGVYLVTVNDYLAKRDGEWVGHMLGYLGITVGVINQEKSYKYVDPEALSNCARSPEEIELAKKIDWSNYSSLKGLTLVETTRKNAYLCDITYGTNSEFGFDYLRDNMQKTFEDMNQRDPFFCVVDEVDSILIDEARTPLIISSSSEESNLLYTKFAKLVKQLTEGDYQVDEKERAVTLTDSGIKKMEKWLGVENIWIYPEYAKYLDRALLATYYYKRDDHYIVHNGEVILVDEFTGRLQPGRRLSDGIHQAIEAKEGVPIQKESRTVATVTYQNYFRLFPILSGMTGTAVTEAEEFSKIYNLDVVEIPTNKPMIRVDHDDVIYKNEDAKFRAIVKDIQEKHKIGQPVLVGTVSVEKSEKLSAMLKEVGIKHEVLNAKNHAREAEIIAKAGQKGAVTISTNMAGRGTDIKLGPGVKDLGGLYVIGTERHESRRIDNQLRGRAGRQGDPGSSRFYLALDDELMRIYGGDMIKRILSASNIPDDVAFESKFITNAIKSAQRRVEAENFDIRKHLVEFDDVLNKQRLVIYKRRRRIMELFEEAKEYYQVNKEQIDKQIEESGIYEGEIRLRDYVLRKLKTQVGHIVDEVSNLETLTAENIETLLNNLLRMIPQYIFEAVITKEFGSSLDEFKEFLMQNPIKERIREQLMIIVDEAYDMKEKEEGFVTMREIEKYVLLDSIDSHWVDHLENMEDIRSGAGFQGYGQKDPLNIYQNEGYILFSQMIDSIDQDIASRVLLYTARIERQARSYEVEAALKRAARLAQESLEQAFKEAQQKRKKK
ncbi:MAG: protein translocase subunit SecA [Candidatus Dojkabacteria bacterium]|nr:MAG: protein translocase subunit SecA [Candidatus Dojkabacteria bacterium]